MARGFDDLNKVFIVQRSKGSLLGDQYGGNRRSLSESSSLTGDITEEAGQRGSMQVKVIEPNNRRYKDICFGSPYRKVPLETGYINCKLADAFDTHIFFGSTPVVIYSQVDSSTIKPSNNYISFAWPTVCLSV